MSEPARRTALLGLLAELRGAGAVFVARRRSWSPTSRGATCSRSRRPRPAAALPFARAAARSASRPPSCCRTARTPDADERGAPKDAGRPAGCWTMATSSACTSTRRGCRGDLRRRRSGGARAVHGRRAPVTVAALHHDERHPFDTGGARRARRARRDRERETRAALVARRRLPHGDGRVIRPAFGVAEAGGSLRAESLEPSFPIHIAPPGVIDGVTVAALVDTVARGDVRARAAPLQPQLTGGSSQARCAA